MKWLRAWLIRVAGLWPGNRRERELEDEMESHLAMHIADNLRAGMPPDRARREAILKSGGLEPAKEAYRDRRTVPVLENLLRDTRYAGRQLRQNPGFTATAVLVLALGLCASVAIFAFVDAALIKPLPYRDPARLVSVFETNSVNLHANLSYPDYLDWKERNRAFRSLEAYAHGGDGLALATPSGSQRAEGARVSAGFFRTLGVTPLLGRDFYAGEDLPAAPRAVLLSYAAWRARYGGNPGVLGQTVTLDGDPHVVIGVLPPDFHFAPAEPAEFWTALHPTSGCDLRRTCHYLFGLARLKDGVSLPAALADVRRIADQLAKQYPDIDWGRGAALMPLSEVIAGEIRPILLVLLGGAALLLLIAGVNVAGLLLVRSGNRTREMAVRTALGAGRARLVSQFVTEGLVLAGMGSALGVALAWGAIKLLLSLMPAEMLAGMPFLHGVGLNFRVLLFAGAVSIAAAALFAITPVIHASLWDIRAGLAESSRGSAGSTWRRLGSKLVVVEIAMAMVLLISAGLLGKSLYRLLQVNIGFARDRLVTLMVDAPNSAYSKSDQVIALERQVISRISNLPGVKSAGITSQIPLTDWGNTIRFHVSGKPWHGENNDTPERAVNPAYFATLGARLLRGRYFNEAVDASMPLVAIVNQALVKRYFPGENPIGQKLVYPSDNAPKLEIVGVVDDIKEGQLDTADRPVIYVPFNQEPGDNFVLVVRTEQAEAPLLPTLAAAIHQIDSGIVVSGGATMRDRVDNSQSAYMHRSAACLVGAFAATALLLSAIGLYGVVAYSVSRRTREIGVRMALGAQTGAVYRLILSEAGWLIAIGITAGVICAMASATLWQRLLFDVRPSDPGTLAGVALVLGIAAFLASYIPARRAASVNPVEALRAE